MNAWGIALDSIWHHKLRSALTALGIVIGVFAVVTLTSLGGGVRNYVTQQFDKFGADLITVLPSSPARSHRGGGFGGGGPFDLVPSTLTVADAAALARLTSAHVAAAVPVASTAALVAHGSGSGAASQVIGTDPAYFSMQQLKFASGGPWKAGGTGVVLGNEVARALLGTGGVGQTLKIDGKAYPVVGILATTGNAFGADPGRSVYMPVADALSLSGTRYVSEIIVRADSNADVNAASAAVSRTLTARHKLKDFTVVTATQILSTINSTLTVITSVLGGIAAISLLVGGIGIMNIMLVTVTERIKEIGTRKALGARDGDILVQFLVEAILLSVLGAAIGTLMSAIASHLVGQAIHFNIGLTPASVAAALLFSVVVGVVFGVAPAMNAARLQPAAALRSE